MQTIRALLVLSLLTTFSFSTSAESNWPQWRGPNFNGSSPAKNLPEKLVREEALWSTPIPGHSNGTPIVWGDKVFTTSASPDGTLSAICISRTDGKILWQKTVNQALLRNPRNDYATPSPVTDGKTVYFLYGSGDLVAFDLEGNQVWKRNLQADHGKWNVLWIYGSSPTLYKGKLYVQVLHRDVPAQGLQAAKPGDKLSDSYLLAVDPQTGKDIFKVNRKSDAVAESRESYGTPLPWERPTRTEIVLTGGDCVTGHDPETGAELWRAGDWNPDKIAHWRLVPSAVTVDDLAIVCAPKKGPIFAWRGGGNGEVTATHLAWKTTDLTSDVCVPAVYEGSLYVLDGDKKQLACADPATGKAKWAGTLDSRPVLRSSPTAADGKIYAMNENGEVWVLATNEFKILSKVNLDAQGSRGSIAAVDNMILIRTGDKLWAFGKK